jgi:hypothetical protein
MIFDANGNLYFADLEQKPLPKWILQEQLPIRYRRKSTLGR